MSNLFIVKASHVAGPQPVTSPESQKTQATYTVPTLDYAVHLVADTESEAQKTQATYAVTNLSYS